MVHRHRSVTTKTRAWKRSSFTPVLAWPLTWHSAVGSVQPLPRVCHPPGIRRAFSSRGRSPRAPSRNMPGLFSSRPGTRRACSRHRAIQRNPLGSWWKDPLSHLVDTGTGSGNSRIQFNSPAFSVLVSVWTCARRVSFPEVSISGRLD